MRILTFLVQFIQIIYVKYKRPQMNKQPSHRINHILFISSKEKTSFEILETLYNLFLLHLQKMRMYSLDPLGKHFEHVVPIESNPKNLGLIDFIIVVGDNETLMDVIRQYCCMDTPPILAIGNGCGPGLYNYTKFQAKELTQIAIDNLMGNCLFTQQLMKITCNINCQTVGEAVCQIEIHRGMNQAVLTLNIYLENEEREKIKIGQLRGDGLLISTPSGSYCKSLCLNGPLMCKTMENIMITPICPLSMKFRPICLPSTSRIFIEVDSHCRSECAYIYFDENNQSAKLNKGDLMRIKMSKFKAKLISNLQQSSEQLFIKSLKNIIRWGENYESMQVEQMLKRRVSTD